jgi:Zn-dependent M28 family amino/carboxypeptidase
MALGVSNHLPGEPSVRRLRAHVEMLATTIGERNMWRYEALERTAQYISNELAACGYTPRRQTFELAKIPFSNVVAIREGTSRAAEIVVVGAHYDSVSGCPGANDNATGVAALLELARRFSKDPQPRTLHFVAFVNEEPPFFQTEHMGSVVYATAANARRDAVVAMLSLETMGYYSDEKNSQRYPGRPFARAASARRLRRASTPRRATAAASTGPAPDRRSESRPSSTRESLHEARVSAGISRRPRVRSARHTRRRRRHCVASRSLSAR